LIWGISKILTAGEEGPEILIHEVYHPPLHPR
jgi:hypothetical protein